MVATGRRAVATLVVGAVLAAAGLGLAFPHDPLGASCWAGAVLAVLWGLGGAIRRWFGIEVGPGEQMLLGTVAWLLGGGILLAIGHASRAPLLGFAAIGVGCAVREAAALARTPGRPRGEDTIVRWVFGGLVLAYLVLNLVATTQTRGNPYDDQVAYVAFVRRVLDCGDLIEPFSLRRLSAYGGQTLLQALVAARGDASSFDLLDHGMFQIVAVLLVLDIARRRRLHLQTTVLIVALLLSLWDMRINSAAIWTGFVCFLGAYSFASREDLSPRGSLILTCATCAAACTLRQNYLAPAALIAALVVGFHLRAAARAAGWRIAWRAERATIGLAIGAAAIVLVPYMIAAQLAVGTALYPLLAGTGNPITPLRPSGATWFDELQFFATVAFNPEPIRVWWLLVPLMLIARDRRDRRPWPALLIGCGIGFALLVHNFMLSDAFDLWRYAFAYMTALVVAFALEIFGRLPLAPSELAPRLQLSAAGTVLALCAVMVNFVETRARVTSQMQLVVQNLHAIGKARVEQYDPRTDAYGELQRSIPEGGRVAVMVDDPWRLDYGRNPIFNLDLPGFAALRPGLPSFTDPAHWRAYFTSLGIRYLMFTEDHFSTYLYRREGWIWRMYSDDEIYRFMGVHIVDAVDALAHLARDARVLFHQDGLYAIDLGPEVVREADRGEPESARMDRFIRRHSEQELGNHAWQLALRANVVFSPDGLGPSAIVQLPGVNLDPPLTAAIKRLIDFGKEPPHRWLMERTHLRLRASGRARSHLRIWIRGERLYTTPTVSFVVDGQLVGKAMPDRTGMLVIDGEARCTGWCDGYILLSTISEWWQWPQSLQVAKLLDFEWDDLP